MVEEDNIVVEEISEDLNISIEIPKIYRYHDEGANDLHWGCVYRNMQTLLNSLGATTPDIYNLTKQMGIEIDWNAIDPNNYKSLWIEPQDVCQYIYKYIHPLPSQQVLIYRVKSKEESGETREKKCSNGNIYTYYTVYLSPKEIGKYLTKTGLPILIDNGISSYMIAGVRGGATSQVMYRIIDPHYGLSYAKVPLGFVPDGVFDYGNDDGKDTWREAEFIHDKEWMMLFIYT